MTPDDEMRQRLHLDALGKVYSTMPADRPSWNPNGLKEDPGFVKPLEPPKQFGYGMELNLPKK
jgi:hypothetical protein